MTIAFQNDTGYNICSKNTYFDTQVSCFTTACTKVMCKAQYAADGRIQKFRTTMRPRNTVLHPILVVLDLYVTVLPIMTGVRLSPLRSVTLPLSSIIGNTSPPIMVCTRAATRPVSLRRPPTVNDTMAARLRSSS